MHAWLQVRPYGAISPTRTELSKPTIDVINGAPRRHKTWISWLRLMSRLVEREGQQLLRY